MYEELKEYKNKIKLNKLLHCIEPIRSDVINKFYNLNKIEIVNGYGPTEATICLHFIR